MSRSWLVCVIAQLWLAGCGNDLGYPRNDQDTDVDAGVVVTAANSGLPCDVQKFLADRCQGCHGSQLAGGAPIHLMTYADLTAKNSSGVMVAQRALSRIKNPGAQMPPLPNAAATAADISMFEGWVTAGAPTGTCATAPGPVVPPVPGPFDGPSVCTSGKTWRDGNDGSPRMHPGGACITCHMNQHDAPNLRIGGTVYPTGHEPNDCLGATNAVVEVTDANGQITNLPVNSSGNFLTESSIAFPIHVSVLANGKRRSMSMSPPNGNCNGCHTQDGANNAPGRIVLP